MSRVRFSDEGYAGQSITALNKMQRDRFPDLFALADHCSSVSMDLSRLFGTQMNRRTLTMKQYFCRSVSHYQAAASLAAGGMTIESMVLTRGLFETAFVMIAIANDKVTWDELSSTDFAGKTKHAKTLLRDIKRYPGIEGHAEMLTDFATAHADAKAIDLYEFARRGDALGAYDGIYRILSHTVAHPSLSAVDVYIKNEGNGQRSLEYRPIVEQTPRAVLSACHGILIACSSVEKIGTRTPETNTAIALALAELENLNTKYSPWNPHAAQA
ncbi:DUF5677 domain-containing protein [Burkholderia lata]|uniref:Uncharacterized protein n=1 Tax=Burkholderia lata (strain ATCC 17760 / DSM 23089 / LMG 22485 / NCIMB 9086 / R18194 / 383) TaxID=482957 RepID=A0A6P2XVS4_BURL3|nr:DUF5677 domain-containing protein [Burkholderia lata]VWD11639.1 hypothetical protein BLA18109_05269 [Burkholderia lata]